LAKADKKEVGVCNLSMPDTISSGLSAPNQAAAASHPYGLIQKFASNHPVEKEKNMIPPGHPGGQLDRVIDCQYACFHASQYPKQKDHLPQVPHSLLDPLPN
jgi:hypothetical protein